MNGLAEKEIARIWQYQLLNGEQLVTEEGEPLQIIHPGWPNDDEGPDFRDAVIMTGRELIRGDIEIHVESGGWWEHGHQLNAVYNEVILHVVMWHVGKITARLQNGGQVPTLILGKYISLPLSQLSGVCLFPMASDLPCRRVGGCPNQEALAGWLDKAGDERFLAKAAGFQKDLLHTEAGQVLYQGVMGALGYSRNKLPFLELARRLPLRLLELVTSEDLPDAERLARRQAWLLGVAGLLPLVREDSCLCGRLGPEWLTELERLWIAFPHTVEMFPDDWHLLRVRPNNSPVLRLIAMSYLLHRYGEIGWLKGLVGLVRKAPLSRGSHKGLEAGLVVASDGYPAVTLLGSQRAADIAVNVLLPFTLAWSRSSPEAELGDEALALYRLYPRLTVNFVERHLTAQLGLDRRLVNSARRQQGLLHLYKNFCGQGKCGGCFLSQL